MVGIILINCIAVTAVVVIHFQFLFYLTKYFKNAKDNIRQLHIVLGVLGALTAHAVEIWLFALVYYFLGLSGEWGYLEGNFNGGLLDCAYYSFTVFTTLGFGDIHPVGEIRYLTGIESLTGLLLIAWSASFLYFEMQRYWEAERNRS